MLFNNLDAFPPYPAPETGAADDLAVLFQADDSNALTARYEYGPDRLLSLNAVGSQPEFYLMDALNSPIALTRRDGTVSARYSHDAWGNRRRESGESFNRFGFTGHEHDTETGLIYAKARYYDPETARFLSQDPWEGDVGMPPSLNKYLYAYQNPTVYVDPDGQAPVTSHVRDFLQRLAADQRAHTRTMSDQMGQSLGRDLGIRTLNTFTSGGGALLEAGAGIVNLADLALDTHISQNPLLRRTAVGRESAERIAGTIQHTRETSATMAQATRSSVAEHGLIGATGRAASSTADATGSFLGDVFIRGDLEAAGRFQGGLFAAATPMAGVGRATRSPATRRSGGDGGRAQRVQESDRGPASVTDNRAIRERVLANIAESRSAREANNMGGGLRTDAMQIPDHTLRRILENRNLPTNDIQGVRQSFDGPVFARHGFEGDRFLITETSTGSASGRFVTQGSAGRTPEIRRQKLALPLRNKALVENPVTLSRPQILLEGTVAPQPSFGPHAIGGGWQVVTDGGVPNDALIRR